MITTKSAGTHLFLTQSSKCCLFKEDPLHHTSFKLEFSLIIEPFSQIKKLQGYGSLTTQEKEYRCDFEKNLTNGNIVHLGCWKYPVSDATNLNLSPNIPSLSKTNSLANQVLCEIITAPNGVHIQSSCLQSRVVPLSNDNYILPSV